jgi:putative ABC transport system permease protein
MKNAFLHDFQYALRQLRMAPWFTLTAALTLALGIAANTTIFSWIDSTLLNPIPGVTHTGRMVTLERGERSEHPTPPLSYPDYVDLREGTKTLSGLLAWHDDYMSITSAAKPERIYGSLVSSNYFEVLGVQPILGRTLASTAANERAGAPAAVLSYGLWQSRFGGDPEVVGKTIQINLHTYTIVGVTPRGFRGCTSGLRADIWIPLGMAGQVLNWDPLDNRGAPWLNVMGVLRAGVSRGQAQNELNLLMQRIVGRYPEVHRGNNQISLDPLWRSPFGANVYLAGTLPILLALAGVLLLLACANVANLLLVRSVSRRREWDIRLSLGSSRWRLVRQLLVENLMVALAGGAAALVATGWTARTLGSFLPSSTTLPIAINGKVGSGVMLAALLISAFTAVASGVAPALRASALSPVTVLKDEALNTAGGLHKSRLASGLVVTQVALSLVLLACAGLFVRSLRKAQEADPGFDPNHVYLATFDLSPLGYSAAKGWEFDRQLLARVKALPGVQSATLADFSPLSFTIHSEGMMPEGYVPHLHETIDVDRGIVGPDYLKTLRTPLVKGRGFTDADNAQVQPVAIVNQAFVKRYWPGQDAIGKRVRDGGRWYTVVGVAADAKYRRLVSGAAPLILTPLLERYDSELILHVRVNGDAAAYDSPIERTVHDLNPNLPLYNVTTLKQNMQMGSVFERIAVVLAGSFGLLAMLLAAVGIYGVISYTTRQRTHEIGIRMALGAARGDVFREILRQGLLLALMGLGAGLVISVAVTRFLRGLLFGVGATDWITFATVSAGLCVVALAACYLPARRAADVEPMDALRSE